MIKSITTAILIFILFLACIPVKKWQTAHNPPDESCGHCHYGIYRDWKITYRPYNERAKNEEYTPVHSRPMSKADVEKEASHREGTGNCENCHMAEPMYDVLTVSDLGRSFRETVFQVCGRCHGETFAQWAESRFLEEKVSCIVCHTDSRDKPLPDSTAYFHNLSGLEGFGKGLIVPSLMLERLENSITVEQDVWADKGKVGLVLIITNTGVGHSLPTDAINAALKLRLILKDEKGKKVSSKELIVAGEGIRPILTGKKTYLETELPAPQKGLNKLTISLHHTDRGRTSYEKSLTVFSREIEVQVN